MKKTLLLTIVWVLVLLAILVFLPQDFYYPYSYEDDIMIKESPKFLWHLANFDGAHYQNIAHFSYLKKFHTAFFPLYPWLTRALALLTGNYLISGLAISLLSLIGSALILNQLSETIKPLILFLVFPLNFFLLTSYTESFFLLLALSAWWAYKNRHFWLTGILGLLASLTRFYGVLLFPLVLLAYFFDLDSKRFRLKSYLPALPLLIMPLGLLAYMYYLNFNYQDPLLFFHSLAMWQKSTITFPLQTLYRYLKIFISVSASVWQYWVAVLEFVFFFLGLLISWLFYRRRQFAFSFFVFIGTLIPSLTGTLQSLPRYLLVLFPLYLLVDKLDNKYFIPLSIASFLLQLVFFVAFINGHFVA